VRKGRTTDWEGCCRGYKCTYLCRRGCSRGVVGWQRPGAGTAVVFIGNVLHGAGAECVQWWDYFGGTGREARVCVVLCRLCVCARCVWCVWRRRFYEAYARGVSIGRTRLGFPLRGNQMFVRSSDFKASSRV
jgi:hypothetical protein